MGCLSQVGQFTGYVVEPNTLRNSCERSKFCRASPLPLTQKRTDAMAKELMCFPSLPLLGRKVGNYICWLISDQAAAHSLSPSPSLLSRPHSLESLPLPLPSSLLWLPVAGLQNSTRQAGSTAVSLSLSAYCSKEA